VNTGAAEICDDLDNDCDELVDDDDDLVYDEDEPLSTDPSTWYRDSDVDLYGDAEVTTLACDRPSGYRADSTDCDDDDSDVNPGEDEACDSLDNDCDEAIDEGSDADSDGVTTPCDCDDDDAYVYPGAAELCDGQQNDCDTSWSAAAELSTISLENGEDWTDYTSAFSGDVSLGAATSGGTLWFCGGSWAPTSFAISNTTLTLDCRVGCDSLSLGGDSSVIDVAGATLTLNDLVLENGSGSTISSLSGNYGGGLMCSNSTITADTVTIQNNTVSGGGGGVYASGCTLDFTDVSISSNSASLDGGGLYTTNTVLNFDSVDIVDNVAISGAGMYLDTDTNDDCDLSTVTLTGNLASLNGGGAYITGGNSTVIFDGASVSENVALLGAGLYLGDGNGFCASVADSSFTANEATTSGGGIYIETISSATACVEVSNPTWPAAAANANSPDEVYAEGGAYSEPSLLVCDKDGCVPTGTCGCSL